MILDNHLDVPAAPDAVFALINDVQKVAGCLPGAVLDGQEDDAWLGRITFKVGPISAAYAGRIRFTEVLPEQRRLRLSARGSDRHGNGDAEADVTLSVVEAPGGAALDLHTDLLVRGKIAQFGKGAIATVANRLLDQFARNLTAHLETGAEVGGTTDSSAASTAASTATGPAVGAQPASGGEALDGLAMLLPPNAGRIAGLAIAAAVGLFQGWLLGRIRTQDKLIKELQRGRG